MKKAGFIFILILCTLLMAQTINLRVRNLNNIRMCDQFSIGSVASTKIAACIADLPSTGGTADARGIEGIQTISSTINFTGSKPVKLLLGAATYNCSAEPCIKILAQNIKIYGLGQQTHINKTSGTGSAIEIGNGAIDSRNAILSDMKISTTASMSWCINTQLSYHTRLSNIEGSCASTTGGGINYDNSAFGYIDNINLGAIANIGIRQTNASNSLTITGGGIDGVSHLAGTGLELNGFKTTVDGLVLETLLKGINLNGVAGADISAYFEDCGKGITDNSPSEGVFIHGSTFQAGTTSVYGIDIAGITGGQFVGNHSTGINSGGAFINVGSAQGASNLTIGNNTYDDPVEALLPAKFAQSNIDLLSEHQYFRPENYLRNSFSLWANGTSAAPGNWTINGGTIAQRLNSASGKYAVDLINSGSILGTIVIPTINATNDTNIRGRWVTFSLTAESISGATSSALRLTINDGIQTVDNDYTITSTPTRYSTGFKVSSTATRINLSVQNIAGSASTFTISGTSFHVGTTLPINATDDPYYRTSYVDVTTASVTGTTAETILKSFTIPGNTLGASGAFRIRAHGSITGTNGTKDIRFNFGGSQFNIVAEDAGATDNWYLDTYVYNITTGSQNILQFALQGTAIETNGFNTTGATNTTSDVIASITGDLGNSGDTITINFFQYDPIY